MQQEFRRSKRVGNGHDGTCGTAVPRDLDQHLGVGIGGELEATIGLRDDHGEEALVFHELPRFRRQVRQLVADFPLVDHLAELFDRTVQERLLLLGEPWCRGGAQLPPVGSAGEQFAFPPDGAGLQGLSLRGGHGRQHATVGCQ